MRASKVWVADDERSIRWVIDKALTRALKQAQIKIGAPVKGNHGGVV